MRYRDLNPQPFFVSVDDERTGSLEPRDADPNLGHSEVEAYLENHRPSDRFSRYESLLVHQRPVGDRDYCYKVLPLDRVDRHHTGWLAMLANTDPYQQGVMAHCAEQFWKGQECKEYKHEPWENRTSSVEIVRRIGGSSRDVWSWR